MPFYRVFSHAPLIQPCWVLSLYLLPLLTQLWTIDEGYTFDNIYVGQDPEEAAQLRREVWEPRFKAEVRRMEEVWGSRRGRGGGDRSWVESLG